jgi:hypothetical protein
MKVNDGKSDEIVALLSPSQNKKSHSLAFVVVRPFAVNVLEKPLFVVGAPAPESIGLTESAPRKQTHAIPTPKVLVGDVLNV